MMKKIKSIGFFFIVFTTSCFAQVGIGTLEPTADLDINHKVLLSDLPSVDDNNDDFNRYVISDKDGNIGYRYRYDERLTFRNTYLEKMTKSIILKTSSTADLNLPIMVAIAPNTTSVFEIFYSVPVLLNASLDKTAGYASIYVVRDIDGQGQTIIKEASRKISFSSTYESNAIAKGRPISNSYFDTVKNETNQEMIVTYDLKTEAFSLATDGGAKLLIGMFNDESLGAQKNFNWGRGMLMISVYDIK